MKVKGRENIRTRKCRTLVVKPKSFDKKKLRFLMAGVMNTIVGLAAFPLVFLATESMKIHYLVVLSITQVFCISFSYLTNKILVFRTQGNVVREYSKFFLFHLGYFIINLITLPSMVEYGNIEPVIAQSIFAVLVVVTSYLWHSKVTFTNKVGR